MLGVAKSSYYDYLRQKKQKAQGYKQKKPGPRVQLDDKQLLPAILDVMTTSPFVTEGVKKVHARLRRIRGCVSKDIGDGIAIRHDWGPQYIARDFKKERKRSRGFDRIVC